MWKTDVMEKWTANKGIHGIKEYQQQNNLKSIDGMEGLKVVWFFVDNASLKWHYIADVMKEFDLLWITN